MSDDGRKDRMRAYAAITIVLAASMAAGGCVSNKKYNAVVMESEIAKAELEKTQAQAQALEQQVHSFKEVLMGLRPTRQHEHRPLPETLPLDGGGEGEGDADGSVQSREQEADRRY